MFIKFFQTLREKGLHVTLGEWLTMQEALDQGLCGSSLTRFYYVSRMILVKSETDFDKFDMAFDECFRPAQKETEVGSEMLRWLDKSDMMELAHEEARSHLNQMEDLQVDKEQVEETFKQRLKDQDSEHNGGSFWIGTMGKKNAVKLLLLMDSGGTMIPFSSLLNDLFQAVHKSNHYKDVKTYYFHNCIYSKLYKTPECENGDWIDTEWMFRNIDSDYKVIIVGDAAMAPEELYSDTGNYRGPNGGLSGYEWLQLVKRKYKKVVWLNPKMAPGRAPWREAETAVKELFPMYKLTVDGLNQAMVKLMMNK